ncbi:MAG TPA: hypothetical protein VNY24_19260 [Candidatus Acidoferrales bacterium]|jgi:hypothetical protein|nr:hypothetical protein [Candidatus Acidoferrales bacterium]
MATGLSVLTLVHVVISLIGIVSGLAVLAAKNFRVETAGAPRTA